MFTKERLTEVNIFFDRWKSTPKEEFRQEFASYVMETRGIPDLYGFPIDDEGNLLSASGRRVRNIINRQGYIGQAEGQAFDAIEGWVKSNKDKDVLEEVMWVSPPYPGVYSDLKVVMSSIIKQDKQKWLFNHSIIFNFNQIQAQRFIQVLAEFSQNYPVNASLEDIRIRPLVLNSEQPAWVSVLEKIINDTEVWEYIRSGKAAEERKRVLDEQSELIYQARFGSIQDQEDAKKRATLILGNKPTSCPPNTSSSTAFQKFWENSLSLGTVNLSGSDQYGSLEFDCPKCKRKNKRLRGKLIPNCQYIDCGANVRC